jgi:tripartite-type tricarboxylate transporter receptor subunit TctC
MLKASQLKPSPLKPSPLKPSPLRPSPFRPSGLRLSVFKLSLQASVAGGVVVAALASAGGPARAETAEEFFRGKQITLIVGYNPGGTYDLYSRLAAGLLSRYIPGNPTIIPKNMPGVASVKAANYLYNQAPKDGLTIGMVGQQLALVQAIRDPNIEYDMRRFNWLGRFTPVVEVTAIWHTSPVKTLNDAMRRETTLAATSAGSTSDSMPLLMNKVAGTKFKIIKGYAGTTGCILAMERGETEGAHATIENLLVGKADWLRDKKISVVVQYAQQRHPAFADVPAMVEFGKTAEDKQVLSLFGSTAEVGRSLMTPPGIPADRLAVLRKAFASMVADPAFKSEVEKRNMEFGPMSGEDMQALMKTTLDISPDVAARAIELSRVQ